MIPGTYNLTLYRGDSRIIPLKFETDDEPPQPHDLSGLTWLAEIRDSHDAETVQAVFAVNVTDAVNGEIELELTRTEARKLKTSGGVWDLQSTDATDFDQTWVKGNVQVQPDVSRTGA